MSEVDVGVWEAAVMFTVSIFLPFSCHRLATLTSGTQSGSRTRVYFLDQQSAEEHLANSSSHQKKSFSYGTIIYVPNHSVIDFGPARWPAPHQKKVVCPRVLLVCTWASGRLALPGGRAKAKVEESPVVVLNREFSEETGSSDIQFTDEDYLYSHFEDKLSHFFAKVITSEMDFNRVVAAFSAADTVGRKGFVDEIFGNISLPLWLEGPLDTATGTLWGPTQVCGLPRILRNVTQRDDLLVLLARSKVIPMPLMKRIIELICALQVLDRQGSWINFVVATVSWLLGKETVDLPNFETFRLLHKLEDLQ